MGFEKDMIVIVIVIVIPFLKRNLVIRCNILENEYGDAMNMEKGKERNAALYQLRKEFGITKFDLNRYVKPMDQKFRQNLGSQMVQEIAERAFSAFEKLMYGTAKKVRFKAYGEFFRYVRKAMPRACDILKTGM